MTTPPESSLAKPRLPLSKFAAILNLHDKDGLPLLIVGGHSVNAWAHYFLSKRPEIAQFQPFTSKDLDCLGTLDDIWILKEKSGWEWLPGKADTKEFVAGALRYQENPEAPILLLEVLKHAQGASPEEIIDRAVQIEITPEERHIVRVPDPLLLLKMKIENAVSFQQDDPARPRQDIKHVRMLTICTHAFLEELLETQSTEKAMVLIAQDALKRFLQIQENHPTKLFIEKYGLSLADCVPRIFIDLAMCNTTQMIQIAKLMKQAGFLKTE